MNFNYWQGTAFAQKEMIKMLQKTIIQGKLYFDKERSFEQALGLFDHRAETYYKLELLFKEKEELFDRANLTINIPRKVSQTSDRYWKNSIDLLRILSQYAVSGKICAWMLDNGKVLDYHLIEPNSEKSVIRQYKKGRALAEKSNEKEKAIQALNKALQKHDKHSEAYERRGFINYMLGNPEEALHDFSKSVQIDETNADAYYGRARVYITQESYENAIKDLEAAAKHALALQPIYWKARRLLADCYMEVENYIKAEFNLKLFTKRKFDKDDPNYKWNQWAFVKYGDTLMQLEKYDEAAKAYDHAVNIESENSSIPKPKRLTLRGLAKMKSGSKGYISDWKEAAKLGHAEAESLLEEYA